MSLRSMSHQKSSIFDPSPHFEAKIELNGRRQHRRDATVVNVVKDVVVDAVIVVIADIEVFLEVCHVLR